MIGIGAMSFAIMGYVISNLREDKEMGAQVDLNPKLLGFIFGEKEEDVVAGIEKLCRPDPKSTSGNEDGRRLVKIGQFAYRVVNGAEYARMRNEAERRKYVREWTAKKREAKKKGKTLGYRPGLFTGAPHANQVLSDEELSQRADAVNAEVEENKNELRNRQNGDGAEEAPIPEGSR